MPTLILQEPEAATEGLGGTYFFANEAGQKIAIMKPCDEEPLAPNNPKGFVGRQLGEPGLKPTVRVGEAASREVRFGWQALGLAGWLLLRLPPLVGALVLRSKGLLRVAASFCCCCCCMLAACHIVCLLATQPPASATNLSQSHLPRPQVAAYLLDHERFARVPHTVMVRMTHPVFHVQQQPQQLGGSSSSEAESGEAGGACEPCAAAPALPCKLGSLQAFVPHDCDTSEMGASRFRCVAGDVAGPSIAVLLWQLCCGMKPAARARGAAACRAASCC